MLKVLYMDHKKNVHANVYTIVQIIIIIENDYYKRYIILNWVAFKADVIKFTLK